MSDADRLARALAYIATGKYILDIGREAAHPSTGQGGNSASPEMGVRRG